MHACMQPGNARRHTCNLKLSSGAAVAANTRALSRLNLAGGINSASDVVSRNNFKLFRDRRLLVSYDVGREGLRIRAGAGAGAA